MRSDVGAWGQRIAAAVALALAAALPHADQAPAQARGNLLSLRHAVKAATVTLVPGVCAGAIVLDRRLVLTAAHCVEPGQERLRVALSSGRKVRATVLSVDRDTDLALLRLARPARVRPLGMATELPVEGDQLLFVGRTDRRWRPQVAEVVHLGRCPSLPGVPEAVFTTLEARKGDSGAPVVDGALRVVGVVHGGARCHIAAPVAELARFLRRLGL